ncbi:MAG: sterol desaturase family protein [Chitinophagales bacterium]
MKSYGQMLLVAMPIFLLLIIVEQLWGWFRWREKPNFIDSVSSLASGMTNILKSTLGLTIVVVSYPWLRDHLALFHFSENSFWPYVITFVFLDFTGYWIHRLDHRVNYFWNQHIVHHSSEEFNLPCALRQEISVFTNILSITMLPLAVLGIAPEVVALIGPIHLFAQFWYHTKYIGKLGFLEWFLVTPSHHRVHHAMNDLYLDKNYGQIFIFWDRWFGTFQEERADVPPIYGVRRPAGTWNPYIINFKHLWLLLTDSWRTQSWRDKWRVWWMPTGWRPNDVSEKYPVFSLPRAEDLVRYAPGYSNLFTWFSLVHTTAIFLLLCYLFSQFGTLNRQEMLLYGLFLLIAIFGFTSFLDKKLSGLSVMVITAVTAIYWLVKNGDWFGLQSLFGAGALLVGAYFVISTTAAAMLLWSENKKAAPSGAA